MKFSFLISLSVVFASIHSAEGRLRKALSDGGAYENNNHLVPRKLSKSTKAPTFKSTKAPTFKSTKAPTFKSTKSAVMTTTAAATTTTAAATTTTAAATTTTTLAR